MDQPDEKWPTSGPSGYETPAIWGSPMLHSGRKDHKWPTSGPSGYITPTIWGVPDVAEWGTKSEVAHKWPESSET